MKHYIAAIMYTAIALGATPSFADSSAAAALRTGDMKKLVFHSTPEADVKRGIHFTRRRRRENLRRATAANMSWLTFGQRGVRLVAKKCRCCQSYRPNLVVTTLKS